MLPLNARTTTIFRVAAEFVIYLNVAWALIYDYVARLNTFTGLDQDTWFAQVSMVDDIASGDGVDPYRYRVLVPVVTTLIDNVDDRTLDLLSMAQIHRLYYLVSVLALMWVVRLMLGAFGFSRSVGFAGAILLAALLPITLREHSYQAWSWLEAVLVALSVLMVLKRPSVTSYALISFIAALNRETSVVLPLIPLAVAISRRRSPERSRFLLIAATSLAAVVCTQLFMRLLFPGPTGQRENSIERILETNLNPDLLNLTRENLTILLSSLVITAIIAITFRRAPRDSLWIAGLTVPPLLAGWFIFAMWWEVRVLLPVVILVLPISLSSMFAIRQRRDSVQHT